jgi:hypothetical protein
VQVLRTRTGLLREGLLREVLQAVLHARPRPVLRTEGHFRVQEVLLQVRVLWRGQVLCSGTHLLREAGLLREGLRLLREAVLREALLHQEVLREGSRLLREAVLLREGLWLLCQAGLLREAVLLREGLWLLCQAGLLREDLRLLREAVLLLPPDRDFAEQPVLLPALLLLQEGCLL